MPSEQWAHAVAASVAPVVIVSASALLCLALYNRLAAIINRMRALQRERLDTQERLHSLTPCQIDHGGVHSADAAIKFILVGAGVVQLVSAIYRNGPGHLRTLQAGLENWMTSRNKDSLDDIRGALSLRYVLNPNRFDRDNYVGMVRNAISRK
jgi:hypothetical protein